MSSQSEVMHCYEQIALLTERMLMLAGTGRWGLLPAKEAQYSDMVDRLKVIEPASELDEAQTARKYQLLCRIDANHAEIRGIIAPQLAKLGAALKSLEQKEILQSAYRQPNGILM